MPGAVGYYEDDTFKEVSAMLSIADIVVLALIAVAFVAVCVRVWRKGSCADCSSAVACTGHCSSSTKKRCPAMKGVDAVARELEQGVKR